jgi:hypothetical protein
MPVFVKLALTTLVVALSIGCTAGYRVNAEGPSAENKGHDTTQQRGIKPPAQSAGDRGLAPPQAAAGQPSQQPPAQTGSAPSDIKSIWSQGIPGAIVSLLGAIGAFIYFLRTRTLSIDVAERSASFEAQKLLLEINKQFLADPALFAIYDDNPDNANALKANPKLKASVEALGYMNLNVFEIVFAKLPAKSRQGAWTAYFLDAMDRCSVLGEELKVNRRIYHAELIKAYDDWAQHPEERKKRLEKHGQSKTAWLDPSPGEGNVPELSRREVQAQLEKSKRP